MMLQLLRRDISVLLLRGQPLVLSSGFLILSTALFAFAIGPDTTRLKAISPGALWLLALFVGLLNIERLYSQDESDGSLDQLLSLGLSPLWIVLSRAVVHWLAAYLPLIALSPIILTLLKSDALSSAILSLLIGTPALSFVSSFAGALTLGGRQSNIIVPLIIFPFMIPSLIFGVSAAQSDPGALSICGAASLLAAVICISGGHWALKNAVR